MKISEVEKLRDEIYKLSELNEDIEKQLIALEDRVNNQSLTREQALAYAQEWRNYVLQNMKLIDVMKKQIRRIFENEES